MFVVTSTDFVAYLGDKSNPFMASSPPTWREETPSMEQRLAESPRPYGKDRTGAMSPRSDSAVSSTLTAVLIPRQHISRVGILPTSLPEFHKGFMEAKKAGKSLDTALSPISPDNSEPQTLSAAEQAEAARRLKPHSRSQLKLDEAGRKPAGMTPVPVKKSKPTRWQFGIRSRNQPLEAIGCIYRALQKLGAEWKVDEDWQARKEERYVDCETSDLTDVRRDFSDDDEGGRLHHTNSLAMDLSHYKLPADPWVLRVRWRKDGMYPPGTIPPGSTHSSMVDLRRHSMASLSSAGSLPSPPMEADDSVVMYLDIQLYEMEQGVYLVDFKCAGYQTSSGAMLEEKDVTSPFPFLDLASRLIIQLAEAD